MNKFTASLLAISVIAQKKFRNEEDHPIVDLIFDGKLTGEGKYTWDKYSEFES